MTYDRSEEVSKENRAVQVLTVIIACRKFSYPCFQIKIILTFDVIVLL